jgi:hypothetical protein
MHFILLLITDPEVLAFFVGHFTSRANARQTYANMSYKSFAWFGVHEIFIFQTHVWFRWMIEQVAQVIPLRFLRVI